MPSELLQVFFPSPFLDPPLAIADMESITSPPLHTLISKLNKDNAVSEQMTYYHKQHLLTSMQLTRHQQFN